MSEDTNRANRKPSDYIPNGERRETSEKCWGCGNNVWICVYGPYDDIVEHYCPVCGWREKNGGSAGSLMYNPKP